MYHCKNVIRSQQGIIVPESQHTKAAAFQILRSYSIVSRVLGMLASIQFHDDLGIHADEVDDVPTQWSLSPESIATELAIAQETP